MANNKITKKKASSKKKYAFYTLGLGLVLLGATQLSPAQQSVDKTAGQDQESFVEDSPVQNTADTTKNASQRKQAINSLSTKNKAAFHTLSEKDQKKVIDAHKSGKGAQNGLSDVLDKDAQDHQENKDAAAPSENQNSPASKSMKKNQQNVYD